MANRAGGGLISLANVPSVTATGSFDLAILSLADSNDTMMQHAPIYLFIYLCSLPMFITVTTTIVATFLSSRLFLSLPVGDALASMVD